MHSTGRIQRTPANYLSISLDIYHGYIVAAALALVHDTDNVQYRVWSPDSFHTLGSFCFKRGVCVCRICVHNLFLLRKNIRSKKTISRLSVDSMEVDYREKTTKLSIDRGNRKQCWSLSHRKIYFKCFFARACLSICFVAYGIFADKKAKRTDRRCTKSPFTHTATAAQWRRSLHRT